ncbi:MAG TPA: hypothetical protein VF950_07565 [Planctomycetota bacterium]
MRAWLGLVLLVGCGQERPVELKATVTDPRDGAFHDLTWKVLPSGVPTPLRDVPLDFTPAQRIREITIGLGSGPTLIYSVARDGRRIAVLKGGVPYHELQELQAPSEEWAVVHAVSFCQFDAAWDLLRRR